jgi:excisionase family DNA binding protein
MPEKWLRLSEVAQILGVHPGTVRSWSDKKYLPVHYTQGGHRRYLTSEIELWMQSHPRNSRDNLGAFIPADAQIVVKSALRSTRFQIAEGRLETEPWYEKLDEEARQQYRLSGRALLDGLVIYLADPEKAAAEAQSLGFEYASIGRRHGLNSLEATRAFLFFRNVLTESMLKAYEAAAVQSASAWSDLFRRVNSFTDQILVTIIDSYQKTNR